MLSHSSSRRIGIHREKRRFMEDAKNLGGSDMCGNELVRMKP